MQELIETPLTWLHVMASLFLVLIVMIQPGRSGGLGALSGAAATQVFGGRGAGNVLTKTTWITAAIFFTTSLTLAYFSSSTADSLQEKAQPTLQDDPPAPADDK